MATRSKVVPITEGSKTTVYRTEKREAYLRVDNMTVRAPDISFKAVGVLCYMLSMENGWRFRTEDFVYSKIDKEGRDAIRTALIELRKAGYLALTKKRDENGLITSIYVIFERPELNRDPFVEDIQYKRSRRKR